MPESIKIIDTVITNLDSLSVRGINNMGLIINSINALGALREMLQKEDKDVPADTE